jgi:phenylacetate-CoA ligase
MDDVELLSSLVVPCRYDRSSKEDLGDIQDRRLRAQLRKAYRNVPYWHELLDNVGIKPDDIRTIDDLRKLPVSTKEEIVSRPTRHRLGSDPSKLIQKFTSGTTGPPMEVYYSRGFVASTFVYLYGHYRSWFGLGRFYKLLQISSVPAAAPSPRSKPEQASRSAAWQRRARGETSMPGSSIVRPAMDRFVRSVHFEKRIETVLPTIEAFSPDVILINASYLRMLADHAGETVASIRPKVVISAGEPLDEPTRSYVERRLGSPVRQMYGSNETASLALDCLEGHGLHVFSDRAIVEVLAKDGEPVSPGEMGEIVVTELLNDGMPLFRYKMRDIGYSSSESCSCGRSLPLLKSVEGRQIDCITTHDGRLVTPKRILTLMHSVEGLPRCQLIQRSPDSFTLRIFPGSDTRGPDPDSSISELVGALKMELGPHADISISKVQSDEPPKRKMRPVMVQMSASPGYSPVS